MTETSKPESEPAYSVAEPLKERAGQSRTPWFAALLSLFITGLGQVYAGRARRGVLFWLASLLTVVGGTYLAIGLSSVLLWIATFVAALGLSVCSIIDAWRLARRAGPADPARPNRWQPYVMVVLLWLVVLSPLQQRLIGTYLAQTFRIPSSSMSPTILVGDWLVATPIRAAPHRGQMVVYRVDTIFLVKRVVGLPHDTVAMHDGELIVNGRPVVEPYRTPEAEDDRLPEFLWQRRYVIGLRDTTSYDPTLKNWGPLLIPRANYLILGDNRGMSLDGRYRGFTPANAISLSPRFIYFSWDDSIGRVRWSRIGTRLM